MPARRIQPDPLYIHSSRGFVSHQIGTSTGPTTSGRAHVTYDTSVHEASLPQALDEDYDMELPDLMEQSDSDDDDEEPVHVHKVVAKEPAKRYKNSVRLHCTVFIYSLANVCSGRSVDYVDPSSR